MPNQWSGELAGVILRAISKCLRASSGISRIIISYSPISKCKRALRDFGDNSLNAYFMPGAGWPIIAPTSPLFNALNATTYAQYSHQVAALPLPLKNTFARLVNRGMLAPGKRPTPQEWQTVFRSAFAPAKINRFAVDSPIVRIGGVVTLSWDAENAERLYVDGVGDVTGLSQIRATVHRDTAFTLRATGATGNVVSLTLPFIRVYRLPLPPIATPLAEPPRLRWDNTTVHRVLQKVRASLSRFTSRTALPFVGTYARPSRLPEPPRIRLLRILLPKR